MMMTTLVTTKVLMQIPRRMTLGLCRIHLLALQTQRPESIVAQAHCRTRVTAELQRTRMISRNIATMSIVYNRRISTSLRQTNCCLREFRQNPRQSLTELVTDQFLSYLLERRMRRVRIWLRMNCGCQAEGRCRHTRGQLLLPYGVIQTTEELGWKTRLTLELWMTQLVRVIPLRNSTTRYTKPLQ